MPKSRKFKIFCPKSVGVQSSGRFLFFLLLYYLLAIPLLIRCRQMNRCRSVAHTAPVSYKSSPTHERAPLGQYTYLYLIMHQRIFHAFVYTSAASKRNNPSTETDILIILRQCTRAKEITEPCIPYSVQLATRAKNAAAMNRDPFV